MEIHNDQISQLRLLHIMQNDPEWGEEIQEFMLVNEEFQKYLSLIPLTRYPMGYGKNHTETISLEVPRSDLLFEHLVYYIACAGVRYSYALKQWKAMANVLRNNGYDLADMVQRLSSLPLQPKKVATYLSLHTWLAQHGVSATELSLDIVTKPSFMSEIKGIGKGAISHVVKFFGDIQQMNKVVETTDRGFIGGFMRIYGLSDRPSESEMSARIAKWGRFPYVGNVMCFQVFHYGDQYLSGKPSLILAPKNQSNDTVTTDHIATPVTAGRAKLSIPRLLRPLPKVLPKQ